MKTFKPGTRVVYRHQKETQTGVIQEVSGAHAKVLWEKHGEEWCLIYWLDEVKEVEK